MRKLLYFIFCGILLLGLTFQLSAITLEPIRLEGNPKVDNKTKHYNPGKNNTSSDAQEEDKKINQTSTQTEGITIKNKDEEKSSYKIDSFLGIRGGYLLIDTPVSSFFKRSPINDVKVSFQIKNFMDYPTTSKSYKVIENRQTVDLDINAVFNNEILKVTSETQISCFKKSIEASAGFVPVYFNIANVYYIQGKDDKTDEIFQTLLNSAKDKALVYHIS